MGAKVRHCNELETTTFVQSLFLIHAPTTLGCDVDIFDILAGKIFDGFEGTVVPAGPPFSVGEIKMKNALFFRVRHS